MIYILRIPRKIATQVNTDGPHSWKVNTGCCDDLVLFSYYLN